MGSGNNLTSNVFLSSMAVTCPYCLHTGDLVWVHGHGQCEACHVNIEECCRGEQDQITHDPLVHDR